MGHFSRSAVNGEEALVFVWHNELYLDPGTDFSYNNEPFTSNTFLNYICKFSSYRSENTVRAHYKDQSENVIQGKYRYLSQGSRHFPKI
jgi:hypothetical protein